MRHLDTNFRIIFCINKCSVRLFQVTNSNNPINILNALNKPERSKMYIDTHFQNKSRQRYPDCFTWTIALGTVV